MSPAHVTHSIDTWKDSILELEQLLADGRMPDRHLIERLPHEALLSSPRLLKASAVMLTLDGQLYEARRLLAAAVRGFAVQADDAEMLSMMGLLALLYGRIGDFTETDTLLGFLAEEYKRTPAACGPFVPWALARGACWSRNETLLQELDPEEAFLTAAQSFRDAGEHSWFALLLLDRWLYDPGTMDAGRWAPMRGQLGLNAVMNRECGEICRIIEGGMVEPGTAAALPGRYAYLVQALLDPSSAGAPEEDLKYDVEAQLFAVRASVLRKLERGEPAEAAAALRQFSLLLEEMSTPLIRRWLEELKALPGISESMAGLAPLPTMKGADLLAQLAPGRSGLRSGQQPAAGSGKWRVQLMGGIRFVNGAGDVLEPKWKRRKSKELLVYLLLQPDYRALRDQVMEHVFGEGETSKLANHLYVSLHELRSTLAEFGFGQAIQVRGGLIGFREEFIEVVDVEQYTTLSRVGDQLWVDDREAAALLYMDAVRLYGLLGADMPYVDWMERWRSHLLERQTQMLRRMAEFYAAQEEDSHTEQWLAAWIELRPDQEEAYQAMIRFWKDRGRVAEAVGWYRRLERMCREELGTEPLEETRRMLWDV